MEEIKIFTQINNDNENNNHIIINYIFRYLGLILFSFALYKFELFYKKKIFKNNIEGNILQISSIRLIYNNTEEKTKNKIIISPLFILLIMIIMILQEISEDIFYRSNLRTFDLWIFELPLLSYFNYKYFKFKIYLHHKLIIYFNIIICGILKIIYFIFVINDNSIRKEKSIFKYYTEYWGLIPLGILTYLIIMISRCFALSEMKVLMQYKYFSPIKLLIIYGIIGAIITIIIGAISTFIECNKNYSSIVLKICKIKDKTFNTYFFENFQIWWKDDINNKEIILLLIGIIMNFLYRLFYILIIKNLTAIHVIFSNLFYSPLLYLIGSLAKNNITERLLYTDIFRIIIYIIIFDGLLIYLEIIELNFCNLNYNLKKAIIDRSKEDYELEIDNEEDDLED